MSNTTSTHHHLWGGIDLKIRSAWFHLNGMSKAIQPPERTGYMVALESSGALIGGNWHEPFYAHLDAFLSTARSVPELIRCCFGVDDGSKTIKDWFKTLDPDEQKRRGEFGDKFKTDYDAFRALPLGTARHISEHRTGSPPVIATVTGRFGVTYKGGPTKPIPTSESRELPAEYGWMQKPTLIRPMWTDFDIDGKPLFDTCRVYLESAQALIAGAKALADKVHGNNALTSPPG
jgi:hypothetical protein